MEKTKLENRGNLLQKISLFKRLFSPILARAILISLFIIILGIIVSAGDVTVKQGDLDVTGDLNISKVDSAIKIYAQDNDVFSDGSSIELYALKGESKPFIAWYNSTGTGVGWLGCHYNLSNGNVHEHCSFETRGDDDGMSTRFEITYGRAANDMFIRATGIGDFILGSGVDLLLTGSASDIRSSQAIDLYPWGQETLALRISNNSDNPLISALGNDVLEIDDSLLVLTYGNSNITLKTNTNLDSSLQFLEDSTMRGYLLYDTSASDLYLSNIKTGSNSNLIFTTGTTGEIMRLKGSGFVGINTSTPQQTLNVVGNLNVTSNSFFHGEVNITDSDIKMTPDYFRCYNITAGEICDGYNSSLGAWVTFTR